MSDLIEALTILLKYGDPPNPTYCNCYGGLMLSDDYDADMLEGEDRRRLLELGFDFLPNGLIYSKRFADGD